MSLIHCADCGMQVSDAAPACPQCGRPVAQTSRGSVALQWVGGIWAALGAMGIVMVLAKQPSDGDALLGLLINMVLFVLPGLALYGIGRRR